VAHAYNPSYSGSRDQEDHSSKSAQANRAGGVAQGVGLEFKSQYHKKRRRRRRRRRRKLSMESSRNFTKQVSNTFWSRLSFLPFGGFKWVTITMNHKVKATHKRKQSLVSGLCHSRIL
jgi:hypothetical protein